MPCNQALVENAKNNEKSIIFNGDGFNTDQGCRFTSYDFLAPLQEQEIRSQYGRKKGEHRTTFLLRVCGFPSSMSSFYTHEFLTVPELHAGLDEYFEFYITEQLHQSLSDKTPQAIHSP